MSDGIFDKFALVDDIQKKMEALADAKGTFRCGLIWDIAGAIKALRDGLKSDDESHAKQIESMKQMLRNKEE